MLSGLTTDDSFLLSDNFFFKDSGLGCTGAAVEGCMAIEGCYEVCYEIEPFKVCSFEMLAVPEFTDTAAFLTLC